MVNLKKWVHHKRQRGLIDYKWAVRNYLLNHTHCEDEAQEKSFFLESLSPFLYLQQYAPIILQDRSLQAVCQLCTDLNLVIDINHQDLQLNILGQKFNQLIHSARELRACYDCGTTARGVFFQLIKAYRHDFHLSPQEIERVKSEYYMTRYHGAEGVDVLRSRMRTIDHNCLFMCAMQLGEEFGHVYILEKTWQDEHDGHSGHFRYRMYQSCLRAYLLIDYIETMDYARHPNQGIDIFAHLEHLEHLFSTPVWGAKEIDQFNNWFKFTPPDEVKTPGRKLFTNTFILL